MFNGIIIFVIIIVSTSTMCIVTPSSRNTGGRVRQLEEGQKLLMGFDGLDVGWDWH